MFIDDSHTLLIGNKKNSKDILISQTIGESGDEKHTVYVIWPNMYILSKTIEYSVNFPTPDRPCKQGNNF